MEVSFTRIAKNRVTCVNANAPLERVMEVLKLDSSGTAVVQDLLARVVGTVTFGDILKFSVERGSLPVDASEVMNRKPFSASDQSRPTELSVPESVRLIPVLDSSQRLQGAWRRNATVPRRQDIPVLVVAGGRGERLRPATDTVPKPLLRVGGVPILERLIGNLTAAGFFRIFISVSYLADSIVEHFGNGAQFNCEITYLRESEPLGTAGSLALLPKDVPRVLLTNADLLTDIDFTQLVAAHHEKNSTITILARESTMRSEFGVLKMAQDGTVRGIAEKPSITQIINGGVYVLELADIRDLFPRGQFSATDLVHLSLDNGLTVTSWLSSDLWLDLGRPADIVRANRAFELTRGEGFD